MYDFPDDCLQWKCHGQLGHEKDFIIEARWLKYQSKCMLSQLNQFLSLLPDDIYIDIIYISI